jgi:hypothetical protein
VVIRRIVGGALAAGAIAGGVGLVAAPTAAAHPLPYVADACIPGYVWRQASPSDHVCVTPAVRSQTAEENRTAAQRRDPNGGPYGPDSCLQGYGYVWRDAFQGDHICATGDSRTQAANDNAAAASRLLFRTPA